MTISIRALTPLSLLAILGVLLAACGGSSSSSSSTSSSSQSSASPQPPASVSQLTNGVFLSDAQISRGYAGKPAIRRITTSFSQVDIICGTGSGKREKAWQVGQKQFASEEYYANDTREYAAQTCLIRYTDAAAAHAAFGVLKQAKAYEKIPMKPLQGFGNEGQQYESSDAGIGVQWRHANVVGLIAFLGNKGTLADARAIAQQMDKNLSTMAH